MTTEKRLWAYLTGQATFEYGNSKLFDKDIEEILNILEEARKFIKKHQRKDEFLELNEWQSRELLKILGDDK